MQSLLKCAIFEVKKFYVYRQMLQLNKKPEIQNKKEHQEIEQPSRVSAMKSFFHEKIRSFLDIQSSPILQGIKTIRSKFQKEDLVRTETPQNIVEKEETLSEEEQAKADELMEKGLAEYARIEQEAAEFIAESKRKEEGEADDANLDTIADEVQTQKSEEHNAEDGEVQDEVTVGEIADTVTEMEETVVETSQEIPLEPEILAVEEEASDDEAVSESHDAEKSSFGDTNSDTIADEVLAEQSEEFKDQEGEAQEEDSSFDFETINWDEVADKAQAEQSEEHNADDGEVQEEVIVDETIEPVIEMEETFQEIPSAPEATVSEDTVPVAKVKNNAWDDITVEDTEASEKYDRYIENKETKRVASKVFVARSPKVPLQTPTTRPAVDEELEDFVMPNPYKVVEQRKAIEPLMEEGRLLYGEQLKELEDTVNDPKTTLFDLPAIAAKFAGVPVEEVLKDEFGNAITPQERIFATLMLFEEQELRKELFYDRNKYTGAYIDKYGLNQSEPGTITDINDKRTGSEEAPHAGKALIRDLLGLKKKYEAIRRETYRNVATERTATMVVTPRSKWVFIGDYIMDIKNIQDPLKRELLKEIVSKYITVPELRMLNMAKVSKKLAPKQEPKIPQKPKKTGPTSGGPNSVA